MNYGYIYSITNLINNKIYIGQTINFEDRKRNHLKELRRNSHGNVHLQNSFNRYGESNFVFTVLTYCKSKEELDELEDKFILLAGYPNQDLCYNIKRGGSHGSLGEETKRKLSELNSGKNHPMYGKRGKLNHNYGRKVSKETREKMSKSLKKYYETHEVPEERKRKVGLANKGKRHSLDLEISKSRKRNSQGYFRVTKKNEKRLKQGFKWRYKWYDLDEEKYHTITCMTLEGLEEKVKGRDLPWIKF